MRASRHDEADAAAAAARVWDRRSRCEDPDLGAWPGVDDLFGVLRYITRHRRAPAWAVAADVLDELVIIDYLRGELDRRQMVAMGRGQRLGVAFRRMAEALRLRSPQAAEQTLLRLRSHRRQGGGPRSAIAARRDRHQLVDEPALEPLPSVQLRRLLTVVRELRGLVHVLPHEIAENVLYLADDVPPDRTLAHVRDIVDDLLAEAELAPEVAAVVEKARPLMPASRLP